MKKLNHFTGIVFTVLSILFIIVKANSQGAGSALEFDGNNEEVKIPDHNTLDISGDITVEAWVYSGTAPQNNTDIKHIVSKPDAYVLSWDHSAAATTFWINDGSNWLNAGSFQTLANQWYHLAGTYDGDSLILYVNGKRETNNVVGNKTINTNNNYLRFGADGNGNYFNGRIDEVRIWNDERSIVEIRNNISASAVPDGIQIYRVDAAPNVTTPPGNLDTLSDQRYWGVFVTGGSSYDYDVIYDYEGHPGINNENDLDMASREKNSTTSWTEENSSLNTSSNTLTETSYTGSRREFILGTENSSDPLPVELINFTGEKTHGEVTPQWATASEKNSQHFVVQRSPEGKQFHDLFTISAAGFSMEKIRYAYTDGDPAPGTSYYRLKQVDLDGSIDHSRIIMVESSGTVSWELNTLGNPAGKYLEVAISSDDPGNYHYYLVNKQGHRVKEKEFYFGAGSGTIQIDLNELENGMYFLVMKKSGQRKVTRIMKEY